MKLNIFGQIIMDTNVLFVPMINQHDKSYLFGYGGIFSAGPKLKANTENLI